MAKLFLPTVTRFTTPDGRRCDKSTPGAIKTTEKSKTWRARYKAGDGSIKFVSLCDDHDTAESMLADLIKKSRRQQSGDFSPFEDHARVLLADHLSDFSTVLESRGNTIKHVALTVARIRAVLTDCKFFKLADVSSSRLSAWVNSQRKAGMGLTTINHHLTAVRSFGGWLMRDRRCPENLFSYTQKLNAKTDLRHERRALSPEELSWLIATTKTGKAFRELSGVDRSMLYFVASFTGLRASELASLTAGSFNLSDSPVVTLEAAYSKRRRRDVLPLHEELATKLREWFADRQEQQAAAKNANLWPGTWPEKAAKMLRADMKAARQAWIESVPEGSPERHQRELSDFLKYKVDGKFCDFHALRHGFASSLAVAGVHPKIAQQLARHSTISLTMDTYSHLSMGDMTAGLGALPGLLSVTVPAPESFGCQMVARAPVDDSDIQLVPSLTKLPSSTASESSQLPSEPTTNDSRCQLSVVTELDDPSNVEIDENGFLIRRSLVRIQPGVMTYVESSRMVAEMVARDANDINGQSLVSKPRLTTLGDGEWSPALSVETAAADHFRRVAELRAGEALVLASGAGAGGGAIPSRPAPVPTLADVSRVVAECQELPEHIRQAIESLLAVVGTNPSRRTSPRAGDPSKPSRVKKPSRSK